MSTTRTEVVANKLVAAKREYQNALDMSLILYMNGDRVEGATKEVEAKRILLDMLDMIDHLEGAILLDKADGYLF